MKNRDNAIFGHWTKYLSLRDDRPLIILLAVDDNTGETVISNGTYTIEPEPGTGILYLHMKRDVGVKIPVADSVALDMYEDITEQEFLTAMGVL